MNYDQLITTANAMVQKGKGILAADESTLTIGKRLQAIGVESSYETRNEYRDMLFTTSNLEKVSTEITNGGTFCVLSEKQQPTINNLKPSLNSKYRKQDLKNIVFNVNDILSGINPYDIKIKIDGKELFYDYIKYRNLVSADLNQILSKGAHTIELSVSDQVNNINTIKGQFLVVE